MYRLKPSDLADGCEQNRAWLHTGDIMMSIFQGNTKKEEGIVLHAAQTDDGLLPPLSKPTQLITLIQEFIC